MTYERQWKNVNKTINNQRFKKKMLNNILIA